MGEKQKLSNLKCKVFVFDINGEFIRDFNSLHECARHYNVRVRLIWSALNNYNTGSGKGLFKNKFMLRYQKQNIDTYDPADFA